MEFASVRINAKLYPREAVFSAVYAFLDKAYVLLDGTNEEIIVMLRPKKETLNIEMEFRNELINQQHYLNLLKNAKLIKKAILERLTLTNDPECIK